ncbi:DNA polymerase beta superfamily protein [Candidatus Nitrospira neomarina]|uniref:Nucleotidyltransferase domain-containing protein n=1 Tax=Candidatus Nitrospira neomarina TaxID=3020899 RepID=A0AA96JWR9_9BACT|nr:nucleotidyltransferase domain-containing protein [Candidatus Nitrospira neomarina]WNM62340.1 nucleotidyltransferase domain-containing protein [Candidatus Nitrospira neomarina]
MNPHTDDRTHTLLKVLVGSHAHGLASDKSDRDYRRVYVIPTEEMFQLGFKYSGSQWTKGDGDETAWEVGQFLLLGTQGHPLILETLVAPVITADAWGEQLRMLLPALWSPRIAFEAFTNYANNQRTKLLDKKDGRPAKYAAAYIRVLYNLGELLKSGSFHIRITDTSAGERLSRIKNGQYRLGDVMDWGEELTAQAEQLIAGCGNERDLPRINEFLVALRRAFLTP